MALSSTQPVTEMSTRDISWGGGGGLKVVSEYGWQLYQLHGRMYCRLGDKLLELSGPVTGRQSDCFTSYGMLQLKAIRTTQSITEQH
jgi:hypothetical protein